MAARRGAARSTMAGRWWPAAWCWSTRAMAASWPMRATPCLPLRRMGVEVRSRSSRPECRRVCLGYAGRPTNKVRSTRHVSERVLVALNSLRSGYASLEYEIAEEKASALGRLGRRLEAALAALAACPRTATSDRDIRDRLLAEAGYALWLFIVQREACGLNDSRHVMQDYG